MARTYEVTTNMKWFNQDQGQANIGKDTKSIQLQGWVYNTRTYQGRLGIYLQCLLIINKTSRDELVFSTCISSGGSSYTFKIVYMLIFRTSSDELTIFVEVREIECAFSHVKQVNHTDIEVDLVIKLQYTSPKSQSITPSIPKQNISSLLTFQSFFIPTLTLIILFCVI